jgi:uncharacterized protein involved in copper resistance
MLYPENPEIMALDGCLSNAGPTRSVDHIQTDQHSTAVHHHGHPKVCLDFDRNRTASPALKSGFSCMCFTSAASRSTHTPKAAIQNLDTTQ